MPKIMIEVVFPALLRAYNAVEIAYNVKLHELASRYKLKKSPSVVNEKLQK